MSLLCSSRHPAINQFSTAHHSTVRTDSLRVDFIKHFILNPTPIHISINYWHSDMHIRYIKAQNVAQKNSHFSLKLQPCGIIMHCNINISCFLMHKKPDRLPPYLFSIKALRVMNINMWLKSQKDN